MLRTKPGNSLLYFSQTYQYDPAGNRVQMTHKEHNDTFNFTYEYDKLNALIAYSGSIDGSDPVTQRYTYDPQGNRQKNNTPEALWFNRSKSDGNFAEFTHDKNGNQLSKSVKSNQNYILGQAVYSWDARNRMTTYQLNDAIQTTSKYQFSGPRYEKKDTVAGKSATTRYYVDAGHRLLSEKTIDDSGIKEYSYVYLGSQKLARISQNDASKKDEISYFLTDAIGFVAMTTYQHTASTVKIR